MANKTINLTDYHYETVPSLASFGADGLGTADDSLAFQDALIDCEVLRIPQGTYRSDKVYTTGKSIHLIAEGQVKIIQTHEDGLFSFKGGHELLGTISSFTIGTANLVDSGETAASSIVSVLGLSGSATVTKGDILQVVSNDLPYGMDSTGTGSDYRDGEYVIAGLDSSGTTVTLASTLIGTHTDNPRLVKVQDYTVTVEGNIEFDTDPSIRSGTVHSSCIELLGLRNPRIGSGLKFKNQIGRGILNASYNTRVKDVEGENLDNKPALSHYGYLIQDCGWGLIASGLNGSNGRHVFSADAMAIGEDSEEYYFYGPGRFGNVSMSNANSNQSAGFDLHEGNYGYILNGLSVINGFQGASSGGNGVTIRGRNNSLYTTKIINSRAGLNINGLDNTFISGVEVRNTHTYGLNVSMPERNGTVTKQRNQYIENSLFEGGLRAGDQAQASCVVELGADGYDLDLTMKDCAFRLFGTSSLGGRVFNIRRTNLTLINPIIDLTGFTSYQFVNVFLLRDSLSSVKVINPTIIGGDSAIGNRLTIFQGLSSGNTSYVEVENMKYQHDSANCTIFGSNLSNYKYSYKNNIGGTLSSSSLMQMYPSSGTWGSVPTNYVLDPVVNVRLALGTAAGTIPNISPLRPGGILNIRNDNNYQMSCSVPNITIPAQSGISMYSDGANYKTISTT